MKDPYIQQLEAENTELRKQLADARQLLDIYWSMSPEIYGQAETKQASLGAPQKVEATKQQWFEAIESAAIQAALVHKSRNTQRPR